MNKSSSTNDTSTGEILGRAGLGALSLDTGWNALQIARDAGRMEDLHTSGITAFRNGGLGTADKARLLEGYADLAGGALNRRVLGIPAHLLTRAVTPSADASIVDRLRDALGLSISPAAGKELAGARAHYKGFADNPRLAMLREIMTDNPAATTTGKRSTTAVAKAVNSAMKSPASMPNLRSLFGGNAYKDKTLSNAVSSRFSNFFLGGQKALKGFSPSQARTWGLTPYAGVMRPAALVMGALSAAGLLGASGVLKD